MQFVCIQMFEIHVATIYFQAIVPALIMTKVNIRQQPYQGKAVMTL